MDAPKCRLCGKKHWGLCTTELVMDENGVVSGGEVVREEQRGKVSGGAESDQVQKCDSDSVRGVKDVDAGDASLGGSAIQGNVEDDRFCGECGTNLSARDRERERRKAWMKQKRKEARNGGST